MCRRHNALINEPLLSSRRVSRCIRSFNPLLIHVSSAAWVLLQWTRIDAEPGTDDGNFDWFADYKTGAWCSSEGRRGSLGGAPARGVQTS